MKPLRSALFMPAGNIRAIAKARTLPCDAVILDLEDAVAPDTKAAARAQAVAAVREGGFGTRMLVVRINGLDTPWGLDDAAAMADLPLDAVLLPKVNSAADVHRARALLPAPALWAMIETCTGVLALADIAAAAPQVGLTVLLAGTNDLAKEMRCRPAVDRAALVPALSQIVVAARAGGMTPLDGVLNALGDPARLDAECRQGAMMGFDGKSLIHPNQIDSANAAFAPDAQELAWAHAVIAAFADLATMHKGAIRLDGMMVERLHLIEAQGIVARSR